MRELLKDLVSRNNTAIDKQIKNILISCNSNNSPKLKYLVNNSIQSENKIVKLKIDEMNKKFDFILKENKELKQTIKNKSEMYKNLNKEMKIFKLELKKIKFEKNKIAKNSLNYIETNENSKINTLNVVKNQKININSTKINNTIRYKKSQSGKNILIRDMKNKNLNGVSKSKQQEKCLDFSRLGKILDLITRYY